MTPIDWAKRPLERYSDFAGRASRPEYWWYVLANIIVTFAAGMVDNILGLNGLVLNIYGPLTAVVALGLLVPSLAVTTRRLHDTNRSGWWVLIVLVPEAIMILLGMVAGTASGGMGAVGTMVGLIMLGGAILLIYFLAMDGSIGDNDYGPRPMTGPAAA